ncbi:MAG: hypothetical protein ACK5MJ_01055 [Alphaproteobacteria bacterium]
MKISSFYKRDWKDYPLKKRIRFRLEAIGIAIGFALLRMIGVKNSSRFCSYLLSKLGPFFPISQVMERNISLAMPEKTADEVQKIGKNVWKNFGLMIGEYPFIQDFDTHDKSKVILEGWEEYFENKPNPSKGTLFFSCHTGNWEYISKVAEDRDVYPYRIFKAPSNPLVLPFFMKRVKADEEEYLLPADKIAVIKCIKALKKGGVVALLTDQKMHEGTAVPFFGRMAPTNGLLADLAAKLDVDILPCRTIRLDDGRLKVVVEPSLSYEESNNIEETKMNILIAMNNKIESWVREYPEQWFWLHKRWG